MEKLKGKRLLISGGILLACDIVEKSKEMGVYTIVADYLEDSPAKKIADESFLVSTTDIDAMVDLAEKIKADGVFTNYIDSNLPNVQKVCERLNLPFCATEDQLEIIGNKKRSKYLCIKHGIPVSKEYKLTTEFKLEDLNNIEYPVLTKPVDSSGQRGISVCYNENDLKEGFKKAEGFSESKTVIVEQYLSGDYIVMNFTIQNGYLSLSAMADKPVNDEQNPSLVKLPKGYIFPSKYIDICYNNLLDNFRNLSNDIGLMNGTLGVEGIVNNGVIYVFEMQYRLGGMKHHEFVRRENGLDLLKMHINYALTGNFSGWDLKLVDNARFKKSYCMLHLLTKSGTIKEIHGVEDIKKRPEVFDYLQMQELGDVIESSGTVFQIFAKVSIEADNKQELFEVISYIQNKVVVLNENRENILLTTIKESDLI